MEQLVLETIYRNIKDKKITSSCQHGFTKGKSSFTNFMKVGKVGNFYDKMTNLVHERRTVNIVYLDFM